ncbi:MAG: ABC transporter ATP-binding protein, partial [Candidatus Omnitrophica bacterium]|nr:ABC transporter ATP-binding protein [Candidatus Omnitrophota bacterium]
MSDLAIKVENLSKEYRVGRSGGPRYRTFRDTLTDALKGPFVKAGRLLKGEAYGATDMEETIWALKDVSFTVDKGEVVGIIGRNGAGKSTLLKILSRITEPTIGEATLEGRVGSLLEIGTGFHPELTGRDNIFLSGAVLGMRKEEIKNKFDAIVEFAEIGRFINTPVKFYSSGMYVRLAFSVAAHLDPEILLVDEVLAVGDVAFQRKCLGKMGDVTKEGRTILFVSHNMGAIRSLCKKAILLEGGRVAAFCDVDKAVSMYLDRNLSLAPSVRLEQFRSKVEEAGNYEGKKGAVKIEEVSVVNSEDKPTDTFHSDEKISVKVKYNCLTKMDNLSVIVHIADDENRPIITSINRDDTNENNKVWTEKGVYAAACEFSANTFGERVYYVSVELWQSGYYCVKVDKVLQFNVIFTGYNNVLVN